MRTIIRRMRGSGVTLLSCSMGLLWSGPGPAQIPGGPAAASLIVNPQQGATPQPIAPTSVPVLPALTVPAPAAPVPSLVRSLSPPVARIAGGTERAAAEPDPRMFALGRSDAGGLPAPDPDPLRIDPAKDPILTIANRAGDMASFRRAIADAVAQNPGLDIARAQQAEAEAVRNEARSRQYPVADLSLSTFQVVSRAFSNDPQNVLERSRPRARTDGLLRIQQPLFDFGSSGTRIRASNDRILAAIAGVADTGTQIALQAVAAWYNVYGYGVLVRLGETFAASQRTLREEIERRVAQKVAAPGDVAQVDSYIASSDTQLAEARRALANAEAQYTAVVGRPPAADLARAPVPDLSAVSAVRIEPDAAALPRVQAARSAADAARRDAQALRSDRLPQLTGGIDAGRYGVIETARDYDVRANLTLSLRLGGGGKQRVDQAVARSAGADARYRSTRAEAERDARIAWSDVAALEDSQRAIAANYLASRRSRDVLAERFRVSRGTLFDLLAAQSNYFGVATRYIQTVIELDTARYVLLARTGRLLDALGIRPAAWNPL